MPTVFVSYSREDSLWVRPQPGTAEQPLIPWLARQLPSIDFWCDPELSNLPGEAFRRVIEEKIDASAYAILLLSHDFVSSDFISTVELPRIRARVEAGQMQIIPILVAPIIWDWNEHSRWLVNRQIYPGKPTPLIDYLADPARWRYARTELAALVKRRILGSHPPVAEAARASSAETPTPAAETTGAQAEIEALRAELEKLRQQAQTPSQPAAPTPEPKPAPPAEPKVGDRKVLMLGDVELPMRWCPPGEVVLGTDPDRKDKKTTVRLTKGFWMGETPVTQEQWEAVMDNNPSKFKGPRRPVECVSWQDAVNFCATAERKFGVEIQLPTEAQWEYACRAGSTGLYCFGDRESELARYGWYSGNSGRETHDVAQLRPNAWGLHDVHGNVWEWCEDWYGDLPGGQETDWTQVSTGSVRVNRGGSWLGHPLYLRSANRDRNTPDFRDDFLGFRVSSPQP